VGSTPSLLGRRLIIGLGD